MDGFDVVSLVAGIVVLVALFISWYCFGRAEPRLGEVLVAFLGGAAVPAGCKLIYLALTVDGLKDLGFDRIYITLGGMSLIWISFGTAKNIIKPNGSLAAQPPSAARNADIDSQDR